MIFANDCKYLLRVDRTVVTTIVNGLLLDPKSTYEVDKNDFFAFVVT